MDLSVQIQENTRGAVMEVLTEVNERQKEILDLSKECIAKMKSFRSTLDANDIVMEGKEAIAAIFSHSIASLLLALSELQKSLQTTPLVQLECPPLWWSFVNATYHTVPLC